jgi:phage head maturation protease
MDTLIRYGDAVKALGNGKVGGYLIRFTDESAPDLTGDFFTKSTDFDVEDGDHRSVYYAHGLDRQMGVKKIGTLTITTDDVGVWVESQLTLRDDFEKAIYDLASKGKLGWSSGAPSHLVTRKSIEVKDGATVHELLTWPIAEGSLTPTPAEPRNDAIALKSLPDLLALNDEHKATWSTAMQNNLPDSSFAFIESGGKKDSDGRTTPRSLRHFPYKDADGKPDAAHVRNALARIPQSTLSASAKASATRKVQAAAKELGIGEDSKKNLPAGWSYRDLMRFLEDEANEDFGSEGSTDVYGNYQPSVYVSGCNLLENPDRFVYRRTDEPGDMFSRPYTIENNDAIWGDEQEVIETTTYVDAPNDDAVPMMAGKQADVAALRVALRESMTLDDHASIVQDAMEGFAARVESLCDLRSNTKAGRVMSTARHAKLTKIAAGLMTAHTATEAHLQALNDMILSTNPDAKKDAEEMDALRTQYIRLQSAQLRMTG